MLKFIRRKISHVAEEMNFVEILNITKF